MVVKSPKNLAIIVLSILFLFFAWKSYHLQATYAKEKLDYRDAQLAMADKNMKAINSMTTELKKNTAVNEQFRAEIKNLKLKSERCQDEAYYSTAKRIIDDYNDGLQ
jgi:cell division protein FtsB